MVTIGNLFILNPVTWLDIVPEVIIGLLTKTNFTVCTVQLIVCNFIIISIELFNDSFEDFDHNI